MLFIDNKRNSINPTKRMVFQSLLIIDETLSAPSCLDVTDIQLAIKLITLFTTRKFADIGHSHQRQVHLYANIY